MAGDRGVGEREACGLRQYINQPLAEDWGPKVGHFEQHEAMVVRLLLNQHEAMVVRLLPPGRQVGAEQGRKRVRSKAGERLPYNACALGSCR
jgi:hypothetical protein